MLSVMTDEVSIVAVLPTAELAATHVLDTITDSAHLSTLLAELGISQDDIASLHSAENLDNLRALLENMRVRACVLPACACMACHPCCCPTSSMCCHPSMCPTG